MGRKLTAGALRALVAPALAALVACAPASRAPGRAPGGAVPSRTAFAARNAGLDGASDAEGTAAQAPVPITRADPSWGSPTALVTIVEFGDFQCPWCARAAATIAEIERAYGAAELRVVWKNNPLPFHAFARPAAETAMALFRERGAAAFWTYYGAVYLGDRGRSSDDASIYEDALRAAGVSKADLARMLADGGAARKVDSDMALADRLGASGTPFFFINGIRVSGAQPIERFREIIDAERANARKALAAGVPRSHIYAEMAKRNFAAPEPPAAGPEVSEVDDKTIHLVPIAGSPVRGRPTALVTIVEFADFQCPFCARAEPTLAQLRKEYGDRLRFVWKNNPLPFHGRAEPAAELALEVRAQKGDAAFWSVHDALLTGEPKLEDVDLEAAARSAGANAAAAMRSVAAHKHADAIDADQDLADALDATGTPTFFINGRRLSGAQPIELFRTIVNQELERADALVKRGTAPSQVYDAALKNAVAPPAPKHVSLPAPTKANPSQGPAGAPVVIHVFGDYQCPYTKRGAATMRELMAAYPGRIRLVWHNAPLSFHPEARLAATAALEAYRQKGAAGFWAMHDLLFEDQTAQGLGREGLERTAARAGLNVGELDAALEHRTQEAAIQADETLARSIGAEGVPVFVINGLVIEGAQPLRKFKSAVRAALAERNHPNAR